MRYFLHLSYDGTNYCGWQVQANAPTVQQTINEALFKLLRNEIRSMGCGRTDTGVPPAIAPFRSPQRPPASIAAPPAGGGGSAQRGPVGFEKEYGHVL